MIRVGKHPNPSTSSGKQPKRVKSQANSQKDQGFQANSQKNQVPGKQPEELCATGTISSTQALTEHRLDTSMQYPIRVSQQTQILFLFRKHVLFTELHVLADK